MDTHEPTPSPNGDRLSVAEAAELLAVHPNTIRHRLRKGHYNYEQVLTPYGPAYALLRSDVEADLHRGANGNGASTPPNNVGVDAGAASEGMALTLPVPLTVALERALGPLVDELARARADAAAAHERAGRLQAERDAAVLERNMERTRRYELEQRRGLLRRVWAALWRGGGTRSKLGP